MGQSMFHLRFSIIIPTFNRATYLDTAVKSALDQMIPGVELIVVDDGSGDDTTVVLRKYGERIKVIQGKHSGADGERNLGIEQSRNDMVAFLDSDDIWLPGKMKFQP